MEFLRVIVLAFVALMDILLTVLFISYSRKAKNKAELVMMVLGIFAMTMNLYCVYLTFTK